MASEKIHPDDLAQAAEIAKAHEFSAHLRKGPHEKYTTRGLASYDEAKAELARLKAEHQGNRGIVYAINRLGSFPCDDRIVALAERVKQGEFA